MPLYQQMQPQRQPIETVSKDGLWISFVGSLLAGLVLFYAIPYFMKGKRK